MSKFPLIVIGASLATFSATGGHTVLPVAANYIKPNVSPSCRIKGNISINTGERIYHAPGQAYYEDTRISLEHGERWFCTEAEARAAGWRRSRI